MQPTSNKSKRKLRHKYELDFSSKPGRVVGEVGFNQYAENDARQRGLLAPDSPVSASTPSQAPGADATSQHRGSQKDAEISATAVVKSTLEAGKDLKEAMIAGLRWSAMWHELPPIPARYLAEHDAEFVRRLQAEFKAEGVETTTPNGEPDDVIPF